MPEVELCCHCDKEIERDQEKYLVVALRGKRGIRARAGLPTWSASKRPATKEPTPAGRRASSFSDSVHFRLPMRRSTRSDRSSRRPDLNQTFAVALDPLSSDAPNFGRVILFSRPTIRKND